MERLIWWVRGNNRRMMSVCKRFGIRKVGSENICTIGEKLGFLAVDEIHYFEFRASEYPERVELMRKLSVEAGNIFSNNADD